MMHIGTAGRDLSKQWPKWVAVLKQCQCVPVVSDAVCPIPEHCNPFLPLIERSVGHPNPNPNSNPNPKQSAKFRPANFPLGYAQKVERFSKSLDADFLFA